MMAQLLDPVDLSTRRKRRRTAELVVGLLVKIRDAEERYMENIPENLQSCENYANAECSLEILDDVICALSDAY